MSQSHEFVVCLPSNVEGHPKNTPSKYETTLARPLNLSGQWEVALIDCSYPHSWIDIDRSYILCVFVDSLPSKFGERDENTNSSTPIKPDDDNRDLIKAIEKSKINISTIGSKTINYVCRKSIKFNSGKYSVLDFLKSIQQAIRDSHFELEDVIVTYNSDTKRVKISGQTRDFILTAYHERPLLSMLGFKTKLQTNETSYTEFLRSNPISKVEYITITPAETNIIADNSPKLTRIDSIFVYSNITNYVMVGNTQTPLLGYFPVLTKFGDTGYWNFNPPYYLSLKEANINSIEIRLCTNTGEEINFTFGDVICRLNFRRVDHLRGIV